MWSNKKGEILAEQNLVIQGNSCQTGNNVGKSFQVKATLDSQI